MTWKAAAGAVTPLRLHSLAAVRDLPPVVVPPACGGGRQAAGLLKIQRPARPAGKGSVNPGRDVLCHLISLPRPLRSRSARRT
jgi:hypothetical protein